MRGRKTHRLGEAATIAAIIRDNSVTGLVAVMLVAIVAAALLVVPAASARADAPPLSSPTRVVSIHLCADQLLLALADRTQISSVSWFAPNARRSHMASVAGGIPVNHGRAEEVIALKPDLVLAGALSGRATVRALRKLGYRVLDLTLARSFDEIRGQIRRVARALGHPHRGAALIAGMDEALRSARHDLPQRRPLAAIYQPMGFTSGQGSLEHMLLEAAGFENLSQRLGFGALGHLTLERLVLANPDLIINWMGQDRHPSLARQSYTHPVFVNAPWRVASIPHKYWSCGTWYSAEAVSLLADIRRRLVGGAVP